jgi:hypothetical protein
LKDIRELEHYLTFLIYKQNVPLPIYLYGKEIVNALID